MENVAVAQAMRVLGRMVVGVIADAAGDPFRPAGGDPVGIPHFGVCKGGSKGFVYPGSWGMAVLRPREVVDVRGCQGSWLVANEQALLPAAYIPIPPFS